MLKIQQITINVNSVPLITYPSKSGLIIANVLAVIFGWGEEEPMQGNTILSGKCYRPCQLPIRANTLGKQAVLLLKVSSRKRDINIKCIKLLNS